MKSYSQTLFFTLVIISFLSCVKEGPEGPQGPVGPEGVSTEFSLVFNPGETYEVFEGIKGFDDGDVLMVYIKSNSDYGGNYFWTPLPLLISTESIQIWPAFNEVVGLLYIHTTWADGSPESPWAESAMFHFKAVVVKSSYLEKNPDLDLNNYYEVEQTLDL